MSEMTVRIITPDQIVFEGVANRIRVRGLKEYFTVLPRHTPMVELLSASELQIEGGDKKDAYVGIDDGILEVANNHVNVLSKQAIVSDERGTAMAKMKRQQEFRQEEMNKKRIQLVKSEMELYRLLRQANES